MTKIEMQEVIDRMKLIIEGQQLEIGELRGQLEGAGVVSRAEYDGVVRQLKSLQEQISLYRTRRHNERGAGRKSTVDSDTRAYIVRLREEGVSMPDIARRLNREGVTAPGGGLWNHVSVGRVIKREKGDGST